MPGASDLTDVRSMAPDWALETSKIPSPGGVPPWEPPEDDSGEWLAYQGWVEWVEAHGTFSDKMQVIAYRLECASQSILNGLLPAMKSAAEAVAKFAQALGKEPSP